MDVDQVANPRNVTLEVFEPIACHRQTSMLAMKCVPRMGFGLSPLFKKHMIDFPHHKFVILGLLRNMCHFHRPT